MYVLCIILYSNFKTDILIIYAEEFSKMKDEIPESVIDSHVKKAATTKQSVIAKEEPITDDTKAGP